MTLVRNLHHSANRSLARYTTRMLGGARRPPPPDYLAIVCHAIEKVLKIDEHLRPFMQEQVRLVEKHLFDQQVQQAIRRVYGPGPVASVNPTDQEKPGKETVN